MADDDNRTSVPGDNPQKNETGDQSPTARPAPPRRRRKWRRILLGLLGFLVLVAIFTPSLLSTGMGRRMVLGVVNGKLNGTVEVADWSLSWNGGARLDGLRVLDESGRVVLQASKVRTELPLLKSLRSGFSDLRFGKTEVENLDLARLHIDSRGVPNYAMLAKPSTSSAHRAGDSKSSEPVKISGDFRITGLTGTITAQGVPQVLRLAPSSAHVVITDLNAPIKNELVVLPVVEDPGVPAGQAPPGKITLAGEAQVFDQGKFSLKSINQKLALAQVNCAVANPLLKLAKIDLQLGGTANGAVDVVAIGGANNAKASGRITMSGFQAGGGLLSGDTFRSDIDIPIAITRLTENRDAGVLKIDELRVITDFFQVSATGNISQESLGRLVRGQAPGRAGNLSITANADKAALLMNQMPRTFRLLQGVKVDSGSLTAQADLWLTADRVISKVNLNTSPIAGRRTWTDPQTRAAQARDIRIDPIQQTLDFTWRPAATGGAASLVSSGELRDVWMEHKSGFAQISGGTGKDGTLAQFSLNGDGQLDKLSQQLGQVIDLGPVKLTGQFKLTVKTDGDPKQPNGSIAYKADTALTGLVVSGIGTLPAIEQPRLVLASNGKVNLKEGSPRSLSDAVLTVRSGPEDRATVDLRMAGGVDLQTLRSDGFVIERLNVDLAGARREFGAVVPALDWFGGGQISMTASCTSNGQSIAFKPDGPLNITASGVSLKKPGVAAGPLAARDLSLTLKSAGTLEFSDRATGARLSGVSIDAPKLVRATGQEGDLIVMMSPDDKSLRLAGGLNIWADAAQIRDIAESLTGVSPAPSDAAAPAQPGRLSKGILDGRITFAPSTGRPGGTAIDGDLKFDMAVTTADKPQIDQLAIKLNGDVPAKLTEPLSASVTVAGQWMNAQVKDVVVVLARQLANKSIAFNGPLQMLQKANVAVNIAQLETAQAVANSFSAPGGGRSDNGRGGDAVLASAQVTPGQPVAVEPRRDEPGAARPDARISVDPPADPVHGDQRISAPPARGVETPTTRPVAAGGAAELPPLKIESGSLAIAANVVRRGSVLAVPDASVQLTNLKMSRGKGRYESRDGKVDLKLAAAIDVADSVDAKIPMCLAQQIRRIQVTQLSGELDVGKLQMVRPIVATNFASTAPEIAGGLSLEGRLADVLRLLECLEGVEPGMGYPYTGYYALVQDLTSGANGTRAVGSLKASKFKAYERGKPRQAIFSEDLLEITNDVELQFATATAIVRKIGIDMQSTGALRLELADGKIIDWGDQRKIADKIAAKVRVDWAKAWDIARPMLAPETLKTIDDLKVAGVMERTFELRGSLPRTGPDRRGRMVPLPLANQLKFLSGSGGIAFDLLSVRGAEMRKVDLPLTMESGVVTLGQGSPFSFNGGQGDLGGIVVDLRHADPDDVESVDPHLSMPRDKRVLRDVSLNPIIADTTIGQYVNPGFTRAKEASGLVNLTVLECSDVPLSWFSRDENLPAARRSRSRALAASKGRAELLLSIDKVAVENVVISALIGQQLRGDIRDGRIIVENGVIKSNLPIAATEKSTLTFKGDVNVQSGKILELDAAIPRELINKGILGRIAGGSLDRLPPTIHVPFSGTLQDPKFDLGGAILKSMTGGGNNPADLLKNLPNLLEGKKKDKDGRSGGR